MQRSKVGWSLTLSFVTANILVATMQYALLKPFESDSLAWVTEQPALYALSVGILFVVINGLDGLFDNTLFAAGLTAAVIGALTFANYHKLVILGEPVYPWDLNQLTHFSDLMHITRNMISSKAIIAGIVGAVLVLASTFAIPRVRKGMPYRIVCVMAASVTVFSCLHVQSNAIADPLAKLGVVDHNWNQRENYLTNGFMIAFMQNFSAKIQNQPDGYSQSAIRDIMLKYAAEPANSIESEQMPNIVLVMNESLFDPTRLQGVDFSEDPLSGFHGYQDEELTGWALSPTFGGGTSNVEFEALTGLSMSFLKQGSTPYQQLLVKARSFPSIVSMLHSKGYQSTAVHPFDGTFYNRNRVYPVLGFDRFITQDDIAYTDKMSYDGFISDMSAAKQVVDVLQAGDAPQFVHLVTMQNHLPIQGVDGAEPVTVNGLDGYGKEELESYAQNIRESDKAVQYLVDSIQQINRPTIVLMWGDHLPALQDSTFSQTTASLSDAEREQFMHETPLLIAANYKLPDHSVGTLSPSYFGPTLFALAGLEQPAFYRMLDTVKQQLPGLSHNVYIDGGGQPLLKLSEEQSELLHDYELVQYDLLYGNKYSLPMMNG